MTDDNKKHEKDEVISTLEEILSELDKQRLFLPALKIVEALDALSATAAPDASSDG
ncbi:hypothetical protein [Parasphingorhabdus sp.]|uniref:hypothetical protein n=1 Tax=Parasphingorhabdus sp. TaxID=2709688 RepID=UPI003C7211E6